MALAVQAILTYHSIKQFDPLASQLQRADLISQLKQQPGQHLVLVKYGPEHSYDRERVYNDADIDAAKVVWARDMDAAKNCKLVGYFTTRIVWSLYIERDDVALSLQPFPRQSCQ